MNTKRLWMIFVLLTIALAGCSSKARVGKLLTETHSVDLDDAKPIHVEINVGAANLQVSGGSEKLLESDFTYNVAEIKPEIVYTNGTLVIQHQEVDGFPSFQGIAGYRNEWNLRLSNKVPMDMSVKIGAGISDLQLAGLTLNTLNLTLGTGESTLDLSGDRVHNLKVTVDAGAAHIRLRLPSQVGVRVEVGEGPHMVESNSLTKAGNVYTNAAYGVSKVTLQVNVDAGIGQIDLEEVADTHTQEKAALQNLLDKEVEKQNIPGVIMAVRLADGVVIWETSGYTSPSGNERWTANTPSLIASVTKTFTAVVVLQLAEEGSLSLDGTVDTWFPEQPNGDKITVRMLLSHTSGLGEFEESLGMDPEKLTREWTPEELIALANQAGPVGEPGSHIAHYSNANYIMLGRITEKVTGNSWAQEVESRIIQPLGLEDTTVVKKDLSNEVVVPGYMKTSAGYLNLLEHPWYPHISASIGWARGGIISSASDLMSFASALFDGKLVSRDTLAIMTQPIGTGGGWVWGLGGGVMKINGRQAFAMGGDTVGYHTFFIGIPDSKLIVTALVNVDEGDVISPSMDAMKYFSQQIEIK